MANGSFFFILNSCFLASNDIFSMYSVMEVSDVMVFSPNIHSLPMWDTNLRNYMSEC